MWHFAGVPPDRAEPPVLSRVGRSHRPQVRMKVALCNLGCSKNQIDGEHILGSLAQSGFEVTTQFAEAELILVNTCTFIREATQEAIESILEMAAYKQSGACRLLVVCGCFSERYRRQVAERFPEVDAWLGIHDWRTELAQIIGQKLSPPASRHHLTPGTSQYLKISSGCSRRCSFCVIPSIHGPLRSRPYTDILAEARALEQHGVRECILVSQDTSSYGTDTGSSLVQLLERLLADTGFDWLRLMYLHPSRIDNALLDLVASEPRVCSYLDIPLQHVADPVLERMRRRPGTQGIRALIERIRTRAPRAAIRTSFIVGFPGETAAHFAQLLEFCEWARFEKLGVFPFSPEEGTPAHDFRPRPRNDTARRRCETLMTAQREISAEIGHSRIGSIVPVLVERPADTASCDREGRTEWDAPEIDGTVHLSGTDAADGSFVSARITEADDYDLYARAVSAVAARQTGTLD
ncbi:MAG: 30S ribosomal protein S12 methylthiotransferase RimO [Chitinivibrionales bacterium]|nr:30S ribosomal protein S12 methylthiotransferase RimO [Chitinivibrionales bacterium]